MPLQSPIPGASEKIIAAIIGDDPRFEFSKGLWRVVGTEETPSWESEAAFIYMESGDHERCLRGAIHFPAGRNLEFVVFRNGGEPAGESLHETRALLGDRPLIGWSINDARLWRRALYLGEAPEWHGEFLSLKPILRIILKRASGIVSTTDLASLLQVPAPAGSTPGVIAGFFSECFPLLLERIPSEFKTSIHSLLRWSEPAATSADFSRFGFDAEFLNQVPDSPGAYIMRNRRGKVIYVGQSSNLKRRVRSYFSKRAKELTKIQKIHEQLHKIEICPTGNEIEALILEMRLIGKLRPVINLQTEIHPNPQKRTKKNLLLFIPADSPGAVTIYFLHEGRFSGKRSVRLHRSPDSRLKGKLKSVFFAKGKGLKKRAPWEMEILSRWLMRNGARLNWIDIDEAGSFQNLINCLDDYLRDPDGLTGKVFYRR